ncbi:hypothetical protein WJX81_000125 [Elliptochloris bilobata]|uniref:Little elongation complex subunit 2 C-terminal domain-containing protein n=1 Tax=Elliptochloris bilobata TaxID=381761 RepID=A0AAW1QMY8_9CHLO
MTSEGVHARGPVLQYPCVCDEPPPGVFITEEAFRRYAGLHSTPAPAAQGAQTAPLRGAPCGEASSRSASLQRRERRVAKDSPSVLPPAAGLIAGAGGAVQRPSEQTEARAGDGGAAAAASAQGGGAAAAPQPPELDPPAGPATDAPPEPDVAPKGVPRARPKKGGPKGGGRKARGPSTADMLNPNNAAYDALFAAEYAAQRAAAAAARPAAGDLRMAQRAPVWSKLSAEEHAWFLENAGERLRGRAVAKLAALAERLREERRCYLDVAWAGATADRARYHHMNPPVAALVEADTARRRARVRMQPRLWRLHASLPLPPLAECATAKPLKHLRSAGACGAAGAFRPPPEGSPLPLGSEGPLTGDHPAATNGDHGGTCAGDAGADADVASPYTQYETWQLGAMRLLTRARTHACLAPPDPDPDPKQPPATWAEAVAAAAAPPSVAAPPGPTPEPAPALVVRASAEYLGEREADEEETTAAEMARWWAALRLRPGAQLLVGHVGAASGRLLRCERRTADDLADVAAAGAVAPPFLCALLAEVAKRLMAAPPGRYLLTHAPGGSSLGLWRALPVDLGDSQGQAPPLPCDAAAAAAGSVVDLWAAHTNSGAIDPDHMPFAPRRWRPTDPNVPQVPFTFALRPAPPRGPGKRGRSGGAGAAQVGRFSGKRARVRKLMPSAWTIGQRLDWDEGLSRGDCFSQQDYTRQLAEDLGA